jgi:hypothetical protein
VSTYFVQDSADSLSAGTHNTPFENHKPSEQPVIQSTSDLNEAGSCINTKTNTKNSEKLCFMYYNSKKREENDCEEMPKEARDKTRHLGHIFLKNNG